MMNKRRGLVMLLVTTILVVLSFCALSASALPIQYKVLIPTPLYSDESFQSPKILEIINQNEKVDVVGELFEIDGISWVKIKYLSNYEGYIPYNYLYETSGTTDYEIKVMKATGNSSSGKIKAYKYFDERSEVVAEFSDGEEINLVLESNANYGVFSKISYNGQYCFVKTENLTTGLTHNQKLALIIASGFFGGLLIVGTVSVILIRKKKGIKGHI